MNIANEWKDYEILDMANGEKLERWKNIVLVRPDPQIIWKDKTFQKNGTKQMLYIKEATKVVEVGITKQNFQKVGK